MSKAKVAIVADTTANLPPELIAAYNIRLIPLHVHWGEEDLRDMVDITAVDFYQRLGQSKTLPTTSQPSVGEFIQFFTQVSQEAESIVGVFISSRLSGTMAAAKAAMARVTNVPIELVDSQSATMGTGLLTLAAARAAEQGFSHVEVAQVARALVPQVRVLFVVDTLEYLYKGGRIGSAQRLVGSMLSIKPLLHLQEGQVRPLARVRTKKKAVQRLIDLAIADSYDHTIRGMAIIHSDAPEEAQEVREALLAHFKGGIELHDSLLTPVMGVHTGPRALGLAYILES